MASGTTYQAIKRLAFLPEREDNDNGRTIGGQDYDDVWFIGGTGKNLNLIDCTITPAEGGGGVVSQTFVSSGTTGTCPLNGFLGFMSATASAKTANIPASTGSLNLVIIADLQGTAYDYPITVVPTSGLPIIGGSSTNQVYTNFATATFLDTTQGWVSV